jgi:long-chain fatty acid transport protein
MKTTPTFLRTLPVSALLLSAFLLPAPARAAAFYLQEQSVSGLGAAFAGQGAAARDASVLFYNPAGVSQLDGAQANIGVQIISPHTKVKDDGTHFLGAAGTFGFAPGNGFGGGEGDPLSTTALPSAYIAAPVADDGRLWLGLGLAAPFGLASKYEDDFFGEHDATYSKLSTYDILPTVSWKPDALFSLGASLVIEYASADLINQALLPATNGAPPPAFFVAEREQRLKGKDWGYGGNFGATLTPAPGTALGFNYRTEIHHDLAGTASLQGVFDEDAHAKLNLPAIASASLAQKLGGKWTGLASASWFGWSSFDKIAPVEDNGTALPSDIQNYRDSWSFAVGAEYAYSPEWTFRAGYQHDQTPVRDGYRTMSVPDGDRDWLALGATYAASKRLSFDVGGAYINVDEGSIDRVHGVGADIVEVKGHTDDAWIGILSAAVNYRF